MRYDVAACEPIGFQLVKIRVMGKHWRNLHKESQDAKITIVASIIKGNFKIKTQNLLTNSNLLHKFTR